MPTGGRRILLVPNLLEVFCEVPFRKDIFMEGLSDAEQTFLLLLICFCLGACFVAAFWELEQARRRWRAEHAKSVRFAALRRAGDRRM
jgi:phage terminase large subunit-like protein